MVVRRQRQARTRAREDGSDHVTGDDRVVFNKYGANQPAAYESFPVVIHLALYSTRITSSYFFGDQFELSIGYRFRIQRWTVLHEIIFIIVVASIF